VNISQLELGWFVGIIDGEGSITIRKQGPTFTPTIKMSNTSKKLIDKYCELLDKMEVSYHCYGRQKDGDRKYQWEVSVNGRPRVLKLLLLIADSLVSKQQQAYKVLEWIESRGLDLRGKYTEEQIKLISDIRNLNGRGKAFSEA
jgi:hypothetical protein